MKHALILAACVASGASALAQPPAAQPPQRPTASVNTQPRVDVLGMARPIDMHDSVWIEDLTMMEVRDLLKDGKTTALILTGGIEENGPYLTTGKHNNVLRVMGDSIARSLGDALVAPIVTLEPGNPERVRAPGSVFLSPDTYRAVLTDMATSLKTQGFKHVILLGDSGGNLKPMQEVADALNAKWKGDPAAHARTSFPSTTTTTKSRNSSRTCSASTRSSKGSTTTTTSSASIAVHDPNGVRMPERIKAGKFAINGVSLAPIEKTVENGRESPPSAPKNSRRDQKGDGRREGRAITILRQPSWDVVVVGAGAAGLATAIFTRRLNPSLSVVLLDGARKPGAKILVSGGSRCNVTNVVVTRTRFLGRHVRRSSAASCARLPVADTVAFFREIGVALHEEAGRQALSRHEPRARRARRARCAKRRGRRDAPARSPRARRRSSDTDGFRVVTIGGDLHADRRRARDRRTVAAEERQRRRRARDREAARPHRSCRRRRRSRRWCLTRTVDSSRSSPASRQDVELAVWIDGAIAIRLSRRAALDAFRRQRPRRDERVAALAARAVESRAGGDHVNFRPGQSFDERRRRVVQLARERSPKTSVQSMLADDGAGVGGRRRCCGTSRSTAHARWRTFRATIGGGCRVRSSNGRCRSPALARLQLRRSDGGRRRADARSIRRRWSRESADGCFWSVKCSTSTAASAGSISSGRGRARSSRARVAKGTGDAR